MEVTGQKGAEWLFEESMLDDKHCVSVCSEKVRMSSRDTSANNFTLTLPTTTSYTHGGLCSEINFSSQVSPSDKRFMEVSIDDLLSQMDIINNNVNSSVWSNFSNKKFNAR